jgi:ADP-heptose:LPS heptosyltransferase
MDKHLYRLKSLGVGKFERKPYIHITKEDEKCVEGLLKENKIPEDFVVVNAGAKSHIKRWTQAGFAETCDRLMSECGVGVIFVGLREDEEIIGNIILKMRNKPYNFINKTNTRELAYLIKRSKLLITNDSAPLHIGCAMGAKVLAIFGPTDPRKYGPTGEFDVVVAQKLHCSPCEKAQCAYGYECMTLILPDKVFDTAQMMLEGYE